MKKIVLIFLILILGFRFNARSDEGMWIPSFVEELIYMQMKKMGLELSPEEIYSVNQSSLKDAIVIFGRGCTAEIISPEGLLITNHHCGYGSIQSVSTPERNLLKNGFWAYSKDEEIPIEGLKVTFLKKIIPATDDVLAGVNNDMTEAERNKIIKENIRHIKEKATKGIHYRARVAQFFEGNEYYTFIYEVFSDVRFVGAPPEAIGKFGADTDNWMWPRHTGDFSMFRVYMSPDGKPADYSPDNVPYKPKHYLPISISGYEEGDFSMILGYPGSTDRYLTSYGIQMAVDQTNPTIVDIRQNKLDIMKKYMEADSATRLKYASKYARTANYWKYFIGQTKGLKRLKVYDKKKNIEMEFSTWANANSTRKAKYGNVIPAIEKAYSLIEEYNLSRIYNREAVDRGPEILSYAESFEPLLDSMRSKKADNSVINEMIEELKTEADDHFKDYEINIDRELLSKMYAMYYKNVPASQLPEFLKEQGEKHNGNFTKYADKLFDKSIFASKEKVMNFLHNPKAKIIEKDPAFIDITKFSNNISIINLKRGKAVTALNKNKRFFIAGLREMKPNKSFYPDANFTMRLTYGVVDDYYPADAVHYNYYTTLSGVMEKEDPSTWEFIVPEKLKKLYREKDYGPYSDGDIMKVCFLTNHDITGGNSGSGLINGKGQLIGLAFDGNWEAMSGDIAFETKLQRCINVDIRYVLFIIDKFGGAQNLIDEMTIVKDKPKRKIGPPEKKETEKNIIEAE